jgi:cardiolipin synthase (CMP-forming)
VVLNVPNLLTAARIVLAPAFLWLYLAGDMDGALVVFAAAAATDLVDGWAARWLHQETRLGAILDAAADKLLLACALLGLAARGGLPAWLAAVVVARDLLLSAGTVLLAATRHPVIIHPTRVGKGATATLVVTVVLALAIAWRAPGPRPSWLDALGLVAALLVVASAVQYARAFRALWRAEGRVSGPAGR